MNRRGFLLGAGLVIAAPAVIRIPGLLMPIKAPVEPLLRITVRLDPAIAQYHSSMVTLIQKMRGGHILIIDSEMINVLQQDVTYV